MSGWNTRYTNTDELWIVRHRPGTSRLAASQKKQRKRRQKGRASEPDIMPSLLSREASGAGPANHLGQRTQRQRNCCQKRVAGWLATTRSMNC
jgi:hypothetical protein